MYARYVYRFHDTRTFHSHTLERRTLTSTEFANRLSAGRGKKEGEKKREE